MDTTTALIMEAFAQHRPGITSYSTSTTMDCAISNPQHPLRTPHRDRRNKHDFVVYADNSMTNFRTPLPREKSARIPLRDKINVAYTLVVPAYRRADTPFAFSATDPLWEEDENYTRDYTTRDFTPPLHRIYATLPSTVSVRSRSSRRASGSAPLLTPASIPRRHTTLRPVYTPQPPFVPIPRPIRTAMHGHVESSSSSCPTSLTQPCLLPTRCVQHPVSPLEPAHDEASPTHLTDDAMSRSITAIYKPAGDDEFCPSIVSSSTYAQMYH